MDSSSRASTFAILRSFSQAVVGSIMVAIIMALLVNWFYSRDTIRDLVGSVERIIKWQSGHHTLHKEFEHSPSRASTEVIRLQYQFSDCQTRQAETIKRIRSVELELRTLQAQKIMAGMGWTKETDFLQDSKRVDEYN